MSEIKLKECTINYTLTGKGPTLVFLHGLSDDLKYWNKFTKLFEKEYQILCIDLRGHGKSNYKKGSISNTKFHEDLYHVLKHLKIKKVTLIGFSLGGTVSLNFTLKHPEMVEKLILMSTFARISEDLKPIHLDIYNKLCDGLDEFYNSMIKLVLPEDIIENNPKLIEKGYKNCLKKDKEAIKETILSYYQLNIEDKIKNIKQPTLIIGGSDDKLLSPYKMMIRMFEEIENSKIIFLDKTKHNLLIPRNIPKLYYLVNNFLLE